MRRRDKAGGTSTKTQRRKTPNPSNTGTIARRRKPSAINANEKIALLEHRLNEALEQHTATSNVLEVISKTPSDVQAVFRAILENATRICSAKFGSLWLREGNGFRVAAHHNTPAPLLEARMREPLVYPPSDSAMGQVARTKQVAHIHDVKTDTTSYAQGDRLVASSVDLGGYRTIVSIPMLKDGELIGTINIMRQKVEPFSERQIALLESLAAQAVIAIENARLFNETQEALERQTATADILKVIASSPADVQPVFDAIASSANRLIGGYSTTVYRFIDGIVHLKAFTPVTPEADEVLKNTFPMPVENLPQQNVVHGETDQVPDTEAGSEFQVRLGRARGFRSIMLTPLLYQGRAIGMIAITRREPGRFADHHVQLLQTFADQAVIAIENVRLFNETKEALERQTATADILKVIASSPDNVQPVFNAIAESARQVVGGYSALVTRVVGDELHLAAFTTGRDEGKTALMQMYPQPVSSSLVAAQVVRAGQIVMYKDTESVAGPTKDLARARGFRSLLSVPLLHNSNAIGAINVTRAEPGGFDENAISLLKTFADQAVIAIENARLFNEVQAKTRDLTESLDQQIATGEVLKAISHSAFDLQPVFDAIAENSVKLCHAERAFIFRFDGQFLRAISSFNVGPEVKRFVDQNPIALGRHSVSARAGADRRTVHVADVHADPEYAYAVRDVDLIRTILAVPMLKSDELVGVIAIYRLEVKPFTDKQVSLVETFAAQAVIAVENTRLINELRQSLDDLRATQDRLVQTEKLASLGQLTAGIAHEIKNPLNFVNNFSGMSAELIGELHDVVGGLAIEPEALADIKELTDMLSANLGKIVQHGQRADAIVKSMLLHSGQSSGEHRPSDINALVDECLNRAYYGERAETRGFSIKLEKSFDPDVGEVDLYPREISRAILNLISNGFYSTSKRKETEGGDYEPVIVAATRNLGDRIEIRIRDNGSGIPAEVKEKMFDPFFTTKPAGEGTGLGLSITHDIIVKQHGGSIKVDTKPDEFAEITLILPRAGALLSGRR